jgi:hypothetical protein
MGKGIVDSHWTRRGVGRHQVPRLSNDQEAGAERMTRVYNKDIIAQSARMLKVKGEPVFDLVDDNLTPVVDCSPNMTRSLSVSTTATGNGSTTIPTGKELYVIGWEFSIIKDATCDAADGVVDLQVISETGETTTLCRIPTLTLTAQNQSVACSMLRPHRINRGSTVQIIGQSFSVGKYRRYGVVYFAEIED